MLHNDIHQNIAQIVSHAPKRFEAILWEAILWAEQSMRNYDDEEKE